MTVGELIELLQKHPKDLPLIYSLYSEFALLEQSEIALIEASEVREDGWVHRARPDKPSKLYLCFPGN